MTRACPLIEEEERLPDTGSNTVKSALPIALLPFLNANPPDAFTCTVIVSDLPVQGTPGNAVVKVPLPCVNLWPLTWVTPTSPKAIFTFRSQVNVSETTTDAPSG